MRLSSVRSRTSVSLVAVALGVSPAAGLAQAGPAPDVSQALPEAFAGQDSGQSIVVTGSRIARSALTSPNPITSVDSEAIQLSGETSLARYLEGIPALIGSLDSTRTSGTAGFIGSTGLNLLNLRNLGIGRTLVLVDGRRHVAQLPETAGVDIGTIPQDLVERVDVVTGGVSAVYGADAVSGVVNFVMKKDFQGLTGHIQAGYADAGEPLSWTGSLAGGVNFGGGRGNISVAYQFSHEGRLRAADRKYLRGSNYCTLQQNTADPADDPNLPDEVPYCGVQFYDSARAGAIDLNFDTFPDLRPDGAPYNIGTFIPPNYSVGGDGTLRADYLGDLLARDDRHVVDAFANYEFSDSVKFFGELKYAYGKSFSESQPTYDYTVFIDAENPLIPASVRSQIQPNALGGLLGLPPGIFPDGLALSRDNFDLGIRGERNTRNTWRGVAGFNGDLADWLKYEVSYVYGQTKVTNVSTNNRYNDRFFAALDVVTDPDTGQPVCRSNLDPNDLRDNLTYNFYRGYAFNRDSLSFTPGPNSGCQPLNLFGEGAANPAAIAWIFTDSLATSKITQQVANGYLSGSIPGFELPGGPIGFVIGAEWRKETSRSTPPPEDTAGQTFGNVIFPVKGDFNVKEVFGELRLPILSDRPFFQEFEANAAFRLSDYSTVGSATTYNLGARWAPVRDISLRGTYARTVRAPNIKELYSQSQTFQTIQDPCYIGNQNNGSQYRQANCAALLGSLGADPANLVPGAVPGFSHGNLDLKEETSKSWTAGAVLRPSFLQGLTLTADWYDIKIRDAISTPSAQDVANLCVDQPTLDNIFCDALTRSTVTGGLNGFEIQPENVANYRTAGLDLDASYRFDPASIGLANIGIFNFRVVANYLNKLTQIPTPGAEVDNEKGEIYAPRYQATFDLTWVKGSWTVNYGFNYFSKTKRYENEELAGDPDLASPENIYYNARHTHDLQLGYDFQDKFTVYAGVNNIGNQKPDLSTFYPVSPAGRFFYMGARVNVPGL